MIKWSGRSKPGLRRLFEQLQDIDVYVEDEGDEVFYSRLFKRITINRLRIERVYALNGRKSVLEKCRTHDFTRRKALFIIDGDLEFAKGAPPPLESPYLHRLDAYCMENKILCKNAIAKIYLEESDVDSEKTDVILDVENWLGGVREVLPSLFAAFATLHAFAPHVRTVRDGVGDLLEQVGKKSVLSRERVEQKIQNVLESAELHTTKEQLESRLSDTTQHIASLNDPLDCVSGKDYLLPLLQFHLSSKNCSVGRPSLRRRLSLNCDIEPFKNLLHHMEQVAT